MFLAPGVAPVCTLRPPSLLGASCAAVYDCAQLLLLGRDSSRAGAGCVGSHPKPAGTCPRTGFAAAGLG